MKNFIYLFFILITNSVLCQNQNATKKDLIKAFTKKNQVGIVSWISCNTSEKFFKSDTIYFYNNQVYERCKKYVSWKFKTKESFSEIQGEDYGEYQGTKILTEKDFYKIKIIEKGSQTILEIYNKKTLFKKFLVLKIEALEKQTERITLIALR